MYYPLVPSAYTISCIHTYSRSQFFFSSPSCSRFSSLSFLFHLEFFPRPRRPSRPRPYAYSRLQRREKTKQKSRCTVRNFISYVSVVWLVGALIGNLHTPYLPLFLSRLTADFPLFASPAGAPLSSRVRFDGPPRARPRGSRTFSPCLVAVSRSRPPASIAAAGERIWKCRKFRVSGRTSGPLVLLLFIPIGNRQCIFYDRLSDPTATSVLASSPTSEIVSAPVHSRASLSNENTLARRGTRFTSECGSYYLRVDNTPGGLVPRRSGLFDDVEDISPLNFAATQSRDARPEEPSR